MKSSVGEALDAKAVKGSTGRVMPGGDRRTGGGGGLLEGSAQKETSVPLFQSSSKVTLEPEDELGWLPNKCGQADLNFPFTESSSSSKVTHPFGLLMFTVDWPCRSKLSLTPSSEDEGLLLVRSRGFREGKGLLVTGSSLENQEVASDS